MEINSIAMNDWSNSRYSANVKNLQNDGVDQEKLKKACNDFETIFIKMMLDSMRKTVNKSELMGEKNSGEEIFEDMLYDSYAEKMSNQADLGISRLLYSQLS